MKAWKFCVIVALVSAMVVFVIHSGPQFAGKIAYAITKAENDATRAKLAEMSKEDRLSPLFAEVAKTLKHAVVEIRVAKKIEVESSPDMDEFLKRFFGDQLPPGVRPPGRTPNAPRAPREFFQRGLGSGVIVDAKNGYVVTNYHVVANADQTQVVLADGRVLKTVWTRTDPQTDLAVIKVQADNLIDAPLGDSDKIAVGHLVLAIGSPEGLQQTVTSGIISATGRTTGQAGSYQNFLQTDAAINHGNSGGPLVSMAGEVIGINTAIISANGGNEGIGFAIPSNMVKNIMAQLVEKGKVTRGFIGVMIQPVDEGLAKSFNLPDTKGALVSGVTPDSAAAKAGIKEGDFLVAVDGKAVESVNELRMAVAAIQPGQTTPIDLWRDGKKMTVNVTIGSQPGALAAGKPDTPAPTMSEKFGLEVATPSKELAQQYGYKTAPTGVVITTITAGSAADNQGLREGQIITSVSDKAVTTAEEFQQALAAKEASDGLRLRVTDASGGARFVFLIAPSEQSSTAPSTQEGVEKK